jgi:hypothetical protein
MCMRAHSHSLYSAICTQVVKLCYTFYFIQYVKPRCESETIMMTSKLVTAWNQQRGSQLTSSLSTGLSPSLGWIPSERLCDYNIARAMLGGEALLCSSSAYGPADNTWEWSLHSHRVTPSPFHQHGGRCQNKSVTLIILKRLSQEKVQTWAGLIY